MGSLYCYFQFLFKWNYFPELRLVAWSSVENLIGAGFYVLPVARPVWRNWKEVKALT